MGISKDVIKKCLMGGVRATDFSYTLEYKSPNIIMRAGINISSPHECLWFAVY